MTKTTVSATETPATLITDRENMNKLVSEALSSLRITGSVLLRESYLSPWAIEIPDQRNWAKIMIIPTAVRVVPFHLVESGSCTIKFRDGETVLLNKGDLSICFGGDAHTLSRGRGARRQSIMSLMGTVPRMPSTSRADTTSLLCGVFFLHQTHLNPLFSSMPVITKTRLVGADQPPKLDAIVQLLSQKISHSDPVSEYVVSRLLEVLCAEVICTHIAETRSFQAGWLRGLADPVINRAITAFHLDPASDWSLRTLAKTVSLSSSRFAARFVEATGKSPMAYVQQWRMLIAQQCMARSPMTIDQVAVKVGYENISAFNRAFKRLVGITPAQWRTRELEFPGVDRKHKSS